MDALFRSAVVSLIATRNSKADRSAGDVMRAVFSISDNLFIMLLLGVSIERSRS